MSDLVGVASVAASARNLKTRKRITRAVALLGDRIAQASEGHNSALSEATSKLTAELSALRYTLAATAISGESKEARRYLEDIAREGIRAHETAQRRRAERAAAESEAKGMRMTPRPAPGVRRP